jgi:hypothetical protein
LGSSSHTAIFNHLPADRNAPQERLEEATSTEGITAHEARNGAEAWPGTTVLEHIIEQFTGGKFEDLVSFWLASGTNLVLGGPFVTSCVEAMQTRLTLHISTEQPTWALAKELSQCSGRPIPVHNSTALSEYRDEFCKQSVRWETFVMALVAIGRAALDIPLFPRLYTEHSQRRALQKLASTYADRCVEAALSTGHLDDMLLLCQYENWILHTMVDGDQSERAV